MSGFNMSEMLEMADILMYYNDVMLCYGITVDELEFFSQKKCPAKEVLIYESRKC